MRQRSEHTQESLVASGRKWRSISLFVSLRVENLVVDTPAQMIPEHIQSPVGLAMEVTNWLISSHGEALREYDRGGIDS